MRSVPEWIATNDDARIPPRVRDRVCRRYSDTCIVCIRKVGGKLRAELDHITPLVLGGQHRESNLRLVCHECHKTKTRFEVKLKSKIAAVRQKHLGIKRSKKPFPGGRASGWKKRMDGTVERRDKKR